MQAYAHAHPPFNHATFRNRPGDPIRQIKVCEEEAEVGQVLISPEMYIQVQDLVECTSLKSGAFLLTGVRLHKEHTIVIRMNTQRRTPNPTTQVHLMKPQCESKQPYEVSSVYVCL